LPNIAESLYLGGEKCREDKAADRERQTIPNCGDAEVVGAPSAADNGGAADPRGHPKHRNRQGAQSATPNVIILGIALLKLGVDA